MVCQGSCFDQSLTWFDETIGKPYALSFVAGDAAAGEDHIHCTTVSDQARQADRAEVHEGNAEAAAVDSEHCIASSNTQIAPECKLETTGHCRSFDSSDHGLGKLEARRSHRTVTVLDTMCPMACRRLFQIVAGTEIAACTGQDGNSRIWVGIETTESCR